MTAPTDLDELDREMRELTGWYYDPTYQAVGMWFRKGEYEYSLSEPSYTRDWTLLGPLMAAEQWHTWGSGQLYLWSDSLDSEFIGESEDIRVAFCRAYIARAKVEGRSNGA